MSPLCKPRSILLVAHLSPPSCFSAARRTAGLTKYLDKLGYRVTVITSILSGLGKIEGAFRVIRTKDLLVSNLNWRRSNIESLRGNGDNNYQAEPSRLASLFVPDVEILSWTPFALHQGLRIVRKQEIDCVITTAPPRSAHLVGLVLQRKGIPWVADFRDGWSFDVPRPSQNSLQHRFDRLLERNVTKKADRVVAVTRPISASIRDSFDVNVRTITNGFDPEEYEFSAPEEVDGSPQKHSLVYTGSLAYGRWSLNPIIEALARLADTSPETANKLELLFAGPLTGVESAQLAAEPQMRSLGYLSRQETLELQKSSDSLLLIAGDHPGVATGKLYEYLAARKPILVLGENSAAAKIVQDLDCGLIASVSDPASIANALNQLVSNANRLKNQSERAKVHKYSYPSLAAEMAEEIEAAIGK